MDNQNNVVPKVTVEEFNGAPETIEMLCRSGFENIKAQENEEGLQDYAHVKLGKSFVTYKVIGMHHNDQGQVALSFRKIKATQVVQDPKDLEDKSIRRSQIMSEIEDRQNEIKDLQSDLESLA